jgi:hypothetical protein
LTALDYILFKYLSSSFKSIQHKIIQIFQDQQKLLYMPHQKQKKTFSSNTDMILSVPCRSDTVHASETVRQKISYASTHYHVPPRYWNPHPSLGRVPVLPCVHVPRDFRPPHHPGGSSAATRPLAPDPASPLRRDPALTRVPRLSVGHGP